MTYCRRLATLRPPENLQIDSPVAFPPLCSLARSPKQDFFDAFSPNMEEHEGTKRRWFVNEDGEDEFEESESGSEASFYASIPSPSAEGSLISTEPAANALPLFTPETKKMGR